MDQDRLKEKQAQLNRIIGRCDRLLIAFSGGVDSSFLLAAAHRVLGDRVTAVTAESAVHPLRERQAAADFAQSLPVDHITIRSHEMDLSEFRANPPDRCYVCKKHVLGELFAVAARLNVKHVAHGVNVDDLSDYRPGQRAAEELGVLAPLVDAGLTKADIRRLSREMGLPTWDKPSMACLASRIPYGTPIGVSNLSMVEAAEDLLLALGLKTCRVRHHGTVARLEIAPEDFETVLDPANRNKIVAGLRKIGFAYVALDLQGYTMGSMNRGIDAWK